MPIFIPPLRQRPEDIPDLAHFLTARIGERQNRPLTLTDDAIRLLLQRDWPGNVRELENCLERSSIMSESGLIDRNAIELGAPDNDPMPDATASIKVNLNDPTLAERARVIAALEQAGWVQAKAARLLGMTPRQIAYRIQTLSIKLRRW